MIALVTWIIALAIAGGGSSTGAVNVYMFVNNAGDFSPGAIRFQRDITDTHARNTLIRATNFIWYTFNQFSAASKKDPHSIILRLVSMGGVAYAYDNQIYLSASHVANYPGDVRREVEGIIYHEMTHILQWTGGAQTWIIEGIADYIRLRAGLAPPGWARPGDGERWDEGYAVTARFLDYCESLRWGFVAELNRKMRTGWNINFFNELLGKSVSQLWTDYKRRYGRA